MNSLPTLLVLEAVAFTERTIPPACLIVRYVLRLHLRHKNSLPYVNVTKARFVI